MYPNAFFSIRDSEFSYLLKPELFTSEKHRYHFKFLYADENLCNYNNCRYNVKVFRYRHLCFRTRESSLLSLNLQSVGNAIFPIFSLESVLYALDSPFIWKQICPVQVEWVASEALWVPGKTTRR